MSKRQAISRRPWYTTIWACLAILALVCILPSCVTAQTDSTGTQAPPYTQVTVTGVTLDPGTFSPGDIGTVNIEVTNTGTQSVTLHRATMYDPDIELLTTSTYDSVGALGAGNKMNFQFTVKADVPEGIYYPVFSLEFQDVGSLRYPVKLEVRDSPVVLSVQDKPDTFVPGQKSVVTLSLSNLRTNTVKNILIHPSGKNIVIIPQDIVIDHLDPGQTVNLNFNLTPSAPTAVDFLASYLNGPNTHNVTLTLPIAFAVDKTQADPVMSNIVAAEEGGNIKITGDVTNSGLQDANSVTVTAGAPAVPVDPYKIYAVGLLKPDDFSSWEITVSSDSPDQVPVIASFKDQDGNVYSRNVIADISAAKNPKSSNTGSLVPWVVVGIIAIVVGLVIGYQVLEGQETLKGQPMEDTPVIRLVDVKKIYKLKSGDVPALRGITFDIMKGEFVAIMGPSGSGKSTLMNMIGCLDVPTSGDLFLAGRNVREMSDDELTFMRRDEIGFIFQKFNLIPLLTAFENTEYPIILKTGHMDEEGKTLRLLETVGLSEELVTHRPGELSGGQQQRVAIARALVNDPSLLLCDEPTGNLDSVTGSQIMEILEDLNKAGRTIVMVTHDPHIAEYARRIIRIIDGRVAA